jgi:hypothetical protein
MCAYACARYFELVSVSSGCCVMRFVCLYALHVCVRMLLLAYVQVSVWMCMCMCFVFCALVLSVCVECLCKRVCAVCVGSLSVCGVCVVCMCVCTSKLRVR